MPARSGDAPRYPVRVVMDRTELTADVLRAWERRYGAVRPQRSRGGQRLYSDEDVERLTLLRRATLAGHRIAEIAKLDVPALQALLEDRSQPAAGPAVEAIDPFVQSALTATDALDAVGVEAELKRGALLFGATALVDRILPRFLRAVGKRWHARALSPAHEHLASTAVRRVLTWATDAYEPPPRAPRILVTTPSGELHEFGAMLAAAAAAAEGWRVLYLGPNLPAAEIADAARQTSARAVALSVVNASNGRELVRATAKALPRGIVLFAGGTAIEDHRAALRADGVRVLSDIPALRRALRSLRTTPESRSA